MTNTPDEFSEAEAKERADAAIRASFSLAPKTQKEMAGKSGRPSRKASKPVEDRGKP